MGRVWKHKHNLFLFKTPLVLWVSILTNTEESELLECLKYLREMDDYYNSIEHIFNLPFMDDNPLSYIWLKDTQDENPRLNDLCEMNN